LRWLATKLVKENDPVGKSVEFSEYAQTQAIDYTRCYLTYICFSYLTFKKKM